MPHIQMLYALMKYSHFNLLKPIITKAFLSNEHIGCLGIENLEKDLDFEISGLAQILNESETSNLELENILSKWFTANYPRKDWQPSQFTNTVNQIKDELR